MPQSSDKEPSLIIEDTVGSRVAIVEQAESLGFELTQKALATQESRSKTETALAEFGAARESVTDVFPRMSDVREGLGAAIKDLAKKSGYSQAEEFLDRYNEKIDKELEKLFSHAESEMKKTGKFGPAFSKLYEGAESIADKSLDMMGLKSDKSNPEREKMRKMMMVAIALMMSLLMQQLGISPEVVGMVGVFMTIMNNNKDKDISQITQKFSQVLSENKDLRLKLEMGIADIAERVSPDLKNIGLKDKVEDFDRVAETTSTLVLNARKLWGAMPSTSQTGESVKNEIFTGLRRVIDKSLGDEHAESKSKFISILNDIENKEGLKVASSMAKLVGEAAQKRDLGSKASELVSGIGSIDQLFDKFKKAVSETASMTHTEKIVADKLHKEMKNYVFQKYAKPVVEFLSSANKMGAGHLVEKIGFSKEIISNIITGLASLRPKEVSRSI